MRKLLSKILLFFIIATSFTGIQANAVPYLEAEGVVLMDGKTGEVLYSKNPDTQFLPASTTKVMTALVVLERTKLTDKVTVGEKPPYADGSSIGITAGQVYTVEELLTGLLLSSGNDTAEALAEFVAGSNAEFGKLMTEKAKELGANNTTFTNPSGLDEGDSQNLTTAYDLSLIMKAATNNPDFVRISKLESYHYTEHPYSDGTERWAISGNRVMRSWSSWYYPYAISGKTGYTDAANHTYTAAAEKDGQVLIASFLKAKDKDAQYSSVGQLFDYGFDNFKTIQLAKAGEVLGEYKVNDSITIPLLADKDYYLTRKASDSPISSSNITVKYDETDISKQPIAKGDILFKGKILLDGEEIDDITLVSGADREFSNEIARKEAFQEFKNNKPLFYGSIIIVLLIILVTIISISKAKKSRKRNYIRKKFNIKGKGRN